eukprot:m.10043 g.10043  ORF g.10043 m.10043 type:complete len:465 (-) comp4188_c0_seq1:110-1504(-)
MGFFVAKNLGLMALCFALGMATLFIQVSTTSVLVTKLKSRNVAAVPLGLLTFTTAFVAAIVPNAIKRFSHRVVYTFAAALACLGAGIELAAVEGDTEENTQFALICIGASCLGLQNSITLHYRLSGAMFLPSRLAGRAVAMITFGGILAAGIGPETSKEARFVLDQEFAGSYLVAVILYSIILVLIQFVDFKEGLTRRKEMEEADTVIQKPVDTIEEVSGSDEPPHERSIMEVVSSVEFLTMLLMQTTSYAGMVCLMGLTPVEMTLVGHTFDDSTLAIEMHLLGMFTPSAITGDLIRVLTAPVVIVMGFIIMMTGGLLFLVNDTVHIFVISIAVVGVGWNFAFVPASASVVKFFSSAKFTPREQNIGLAFNETVMLFIAAAMTVASSFYYDAVGWESYVWTCTAVIAVGFVASCFWLTRQRQRSYKMAITQRQERMRTNENELNLEEPQERIIKVQNVVTSIEF